MQRKGETNQPTGVTANLGVITPEPWPTRLACQSGSENFEKRRNLPGPAPDPNALRRDRKDDQGSWTTLPAEGRIGAPPDWPLTRPTKRELAQWQREWARPQAVMWERDGQQEEVALYVRTLIASEAAPDPKLLPILLRQQEALGLSQPGLLRRRWKIAEPSTAAKKRTNDPDRAATKAALRSITGGAA